MSSNDCPAIPGSGPGATRSTLTAPALPGRRALIVDDNPSVGTTVARVARRCGYDTIVTDDAGDFLARAETWKPTLVIIDLVMPDVDGIELIRHLGKRKSPARVMLISGFDARVLEVAQQLGEAYGLAMMSSLRKPFRADELAGMLRALASADPRSPDRIRGALDAGAFRLVYQPKYELASRCVVGVEVLARWDDAELGPVPPSVFIPAAEEAGMITDVTRWVLETALVQQATWNRQGIRLNVAINLSQPDLESGDLPARFVEDCRRHGIDPTSVTFEVTESMAMRDPLAVMQTLSRLRLAGAKISIDDFGTGYSSLVHLRRLPFSELKIDRSFVADCQRSRESRIIIKSLIDLAHNLDLQTVAEGAETEEHLHILEELGCDLVQGYALSPPVEADRIPDLVAAPRRS